MPSQWTDHYVTSSHCQMLDIDVAAILVCCGVWVNSPCWWCLTNLEIGKIPTEQRLGSFALKINTNHVTISNVLLSKDY